MTLKYDLAQYFRQQSFRRQARRWLRANNDVAIAVTIMFHLNRFARATRHHMAKSFIYSLKNCLIHHLCRQGYCMQVMQQLQVLKCNTCDNGIYWTGEECWHCGGTGIYRTTLLYQFVFDVDGKRYIWHQPAALVWWPVQPVNNEPLDWQPPKNGWDWTMSWKLLGLYTMTVFEFLRMHGATEYQRTMSFVPFDTAEASRNPIRKTFTLKPPYSLRSIILGGLKQLYWGWYWRWRTVKRLVTKRRTRMIEDEIPF